MKHKSYHDTHVTLAADTIRIGYFFVGMRPLGARNGPPVQLVSTDIDYATDSWLASWMLATYHRGQVLAGCLGSLAQKTACSSLWLCLQARTSNARC